MYCSQCGKEVIPSMPRCLFCGSRLGKGNVKMEQNKVESSNINPETITQILNDGEQTKNQECVQIEPKQDN